MNEKGRGSTRERGGADGWPRNEKFPIGSGDHIGSPLRHREYAQEKASKLAKNSGTEHGRAPTKRQRSAFCGKEEAPTIK